MSDAELVTDFLSWGSVGLKEHIRVFQGCINMDYSATDAPTLDTTSDDADSIYAIFYECGGDCTGDFSTWDTSTITQFGDAFRECAWDPTGVGDWDVTAGVYMNRVFLDAENFNQDLSGWEPTEANDFEFFLDGATSWSDANYDLLLAAWSLLTFTNSGMDFECEAQYTETAARSVLTGSPNNWTITDGGAA